MRPLSLNNNKLGFIRRNVGLITAIEIKKQGTVYSEKDKLIPT